jgi:cell division protein FtsB
MKNLITSKKIVGIIFFLVILIILAFLFFNENGIIKYLRLKSEITRLKENIKNADEEIKILESEIDSLRNSNTKIEKLARERFHMMNKNEEVLKVEER